MYWDVNNLYELAMSQKLPIEGFEWVKNMPELNEDFLKNYNKDIGIGYTLEVDVIYPD